MNEDDLPQESNELPAQHAPSVARREWLFLRTALMFAAFCAADGIEQGTIHDQLSLAEIDDFEDLIFKRL